MGPTIMTTETAAPAAAPRPLSRVIAEHSQTAGERGSVEELPATLSDCSFTTDLLPNPPGFSTIFGMPLVLIASQILIGRSRPWLPRWLRERSLDGRTFSRIASGLERFLRRMELLARPRYWPMPRVVAERCVGLAVLLMAFVLVFPIPFGNWTPAVAAILVSLGLCKRDGLWLGCGAPVAAGSLGLAAGVVVSIGLAANGILQ